MKKYSVWFFIVVFTVVFFNSCTVQKSTNSTVKSMDIYGSGVMHLPVVVDLVVSNSKVTATVSSSSTSTSIEDLKTAATSKAISDSQADILVEPSFVVETVGYEKTVTVTGFPANYANFRSITQDDVALLQVGALQVADVSQNTTVNQQKSNSHKTAIVVTALSVAAGVLLAIIAF